MILPPEIRQKLLRALAPITKTAFAGCGSIWTFHRITSPLDHERIGWCQDIEHDIDTLKALVTAVRAQGYTFISIGELCERLKRGQSTPKCIVITFDDGYRDVYTNAYPFFKSEGIPFTVYVSTGFIDQRLIPWWFPLETAIAMARLNQRSDFDLRSPAGKLRAFKHYSKQFDAAPPEEQAALIKKLIGEDALEQSLQMFLTWEQIQELTQDPLFTLGAHTINHANLKQLTTNEVLYEMTESKRILSERTGIPIHHFAYPFGSPHCVGPREFALAHKAGYQSAVTTRLANIFNEHRENLCALPRIYGATADDFLTAMSGAPTLIRYRKRVVFDR